MTVPTLQIEYLDTWFSLHFSQCSLWSVFPIQHARADPTNILALECALQRQELTRPEPTNVTPVHLARSHRVVRAQRYRSAGSIQHFRLFSLCSAGRNIESLRFETYAMPLHIRFYLESLRDFLWSDIHLRVDIIDLSPDSHDNAIFSARAKYVQSLCQSSGRPRNGASRWRRYRLDAETSEQCERTTSHKWNRF
jgi:hypothetical protein